MSLTSETSFVVDNQDLALSGANYSATKIPFKSQSVVDSLYIAQAPSSQSNQVFIMFASCKYFVLQLRRVTFISQLVSSIRSDDFLFRGTRNLHIVISYS